MAKDMNDSATLELIPAAKKRGRPASGKALTNAERQRLFRERKKDRVQIDLSSDDWAVLSAILRMQYESDSGNKEGQVIYSHIVEQVYLAGAKRSGMPAWFDENRYKEPVTVTENQPAQESVSVTEIEVIEDKPVTVTKKTRTKKGHAVVLPRSLGAEPFTVTEIPNTSKSVTVTKNNFPARYAHPAEPLLTWTGRGRKPLWVQEWLAAGGKLEYLEIPTATPLP